VAVDGSQVQRGLVQRDTDEYSYVIEGEVGARVGTDEVTARTGDYIFKPRRLPHTFWNPTDRPARLLEIIVPAGSRISSRRGRRSSVAQARRRSWANG